MRERIEKTGAGVGGEVPCAPAPVKGLRCGWCPALIELRSSLSLCHDLIDARPLDEAIEDDQEGLLVFVGELIDLLVKAVQFQVPNDSLGRSVGASGHLAEG